MMPLATPFPRVCGYRFALCPRGSKMPRVVQFLLVNYLYSSILLHPKRACSQNGVGPLFIQVLVRLNLSANAVD